MIYAWILTTSYVSRGSKECDSGQVLSTRAAAFRCAEKIWLLLSEDADESTFEAWAEKQLIDDPEAGFAYEIWRGRPGEDALSWEEH